MNEDADHHYMMFSATFNKACRQLARKYLAADHVRIRIGRPGSTHVNVDQNVRALTPFIEAVTRRLTFVDHLGGKASEEAGALRHVAGDASFADSYLCQQQETGRSAR